MINIVCVLKSGGDYDVGYVKNLKRFIDNSVTLPHRFICFSDIHVQLDVDYVIPLTNNLPGWWSKLEVFNIKGKSLFFDLDTAILSNIDSLIYELTKQGGDFISLLAPWKNRETFATGVMAWSGDFKFLLTDLSINDIARYKWDQRYIARKLADKKIYVSPLQSFYPYIWSYKLDIVENNRTPAGIVCFHGKPRPHEVGGIYYEN